MDFYYRPLDGHFIVIDNSGAVIWNTNKAMGKYDSDGNLLWHIDDVHGSVAVDEEGNIYVGNHPGEFARRLASEEGKFTLAKYSSLGELLWSAEPEIESSKGYTGILLDGSGNVCVCGTLEVDKTTHVTILIIA